MEYVVFRLYGPMASWGEIAVGEARHTAAYPSKSAVVGLLAAALGIKRDQDERQSNLITAYTQAVKVLTRGRILKDYHTAQAPDSVGKFRYRTRRDEIMIGKERLGTVLSSREYRTDAQAIVAIALTGDGYFSVKQLASALLKPKFHLYLGRKACPLAAPLDPQIITADNFRQALNHYRVKPLLIDQPAWNDDARWLPDAVMTHYYWEGSVQDFSLDDAQFKAQQVQRLLRYDKPISRARWQFEARSEYFWQCAKEAS